jgi:hypothetical protein
MSVLPPKADIDPLRCRLRSHRLLRCSRGHSVSVLWRGGEVDTIFGFEKEEDALQWIKEKSQAWLLANER